MVVEYIIGGVIAVAFVVGIVALSCKLGKDLWW
jgi:hypothetical protein